MGIEPAAVRGPLERTSVPTTSAKLLASAAAALTFSLAPGAALAADAAPARVMPADAVSDCSSQGKVWLVVQDSKGKALVDKCVETAATGSELLTKADVKTTLDPKTKMICTMEGEPAACPTKFDGNYWHYYTAAKPGTWAFSQKGADQAKPVAGGAEGWCYGRECTPAKPGTTPAATATPSAAPAADEKKSNKGTITTVLVAAIVGGLVAAFYVAKRKKS